MRLKLIPVVLFALSISWTASAAQAEGGFSKIELAIVSKLLDRYGLVGLTESLPNGAPKAMTLAVRIRAPRSAVFEVFKDPTKFNYISSLFEEGKVLETDKSSTAYSWASRHQLFSVVGTNTVTLFPPRRIDVSIVKSSLGSGNVSIRLYEEGPEQTLFVLSGLVDVESSEWLIRFLVGNSPSMKHAMNAAIGLVVVKGAKYMAETVAKNKPLRYHKTYGGRRGALRSVSPADMKAVGPLLNRGTVILTSSVPHGRLNEAVVIEKVAAPVLKFIGAASRPEFYPLMLKAVTDVQVHSRTPQSVEFTWTLGLSVFGLTSRSRMTIVEDGVVWDGLEGDLAGAKWRWQAVADGPDRCIVAYHGWANIPKSTFILEKSMRREPYLEHGFLVGSNMVMLRSVKRAVESLSLPSTPVSGTEPSSDSPADTEKSAP